MASWSFFGDYKFFGSVLALKPYEATVGCEQQLFNRTIGNQSTVGTIHQSATVPFDNLVAPTYNAQLRVYTLPSYYSPNQNYMYAGVTHQCYSPANAKPWYSFGFGRKVYSGFAYNPHVKDIFTGKLECTVDPADLRNIRSTIGVEFGLEF